MKPRQVVTEYFFRRVVFCNKSDRLFYFLLLAVGILIGLFARG
ncbi:MULTISPECIES: hypothetical protein [unclassified Microcoleus]